MKLKDWRTENRYTLPGFARFLKKETGIAVTGRTIHNWETGASSPSLRKAEAVRQVTRGKVKPESFVRASTVSA